MKKNKNPAESVSSKLVREIVTILGIRLDSISVRGVLRFVAISIVKKRKFYIVTPNPEIVMQSQGDSELKMILNQADVSIPDGIGLSAAAKFLSQETPDNFFLRVSTLLLRGISIGLLIIFDQSSLTSRLPIIKGREMFTEFIRLGNKKGWKIFLIGDRQKSAQRARDILSANYKNVKIFSGDGPNLNLDAKPVSSQDGEIEREVIAKINEIGPQMLFVGFGAPRQEKWIAKWLPKLNIGGAMVVGGAFDYIAGSVRLPPKWISEMGFEWLWRILTGSQKWNRIKVAVIDFPLKVFWTKLTSSFS